MTKDLANVSEIKIGIIGPNYLVSTCKRVLLSFPNFYPVYRDIDDESELHKLVYELTKEVDVLMFMEYHLYFQVKKKIDFTVPVHYMPRMGIGLYRALFFVRNNYQPNSLSVDSVEEKYIEQILNELDYCVDNTVLFNDYNSNGIIECMTNFHIKNYKKYNTIALTGTYEVSVNLNKKNIPNELVFPSKQDMTVAFERALLASEARRNKESQIVFGFVNIDNFSKVVERYTLEHDVQELKLQLQRNLLDYTRQLDGHLINIGSNEFIFITTRGIFERETRGYKFIPLLQETKNKLGITLSIGVGFGSSAAEAGNHARLALRQAKDLGGNSCYIVREDRSVIGPVDILTNQQYKQYSLSVTDPELLERAEKAGMSAVYMTKLMARVARHNKYDYTAQELATTLNITTRSAHRILLKWMDANIVDIIGEERVSGRGRPRRIYRLKFLLE